MGDMDRGRGREDGRWRTEPEVRRPQPWRGRGEGGATEVPAIGGGREDQKRHRRRSCTGRATSPPAILTAELGTGLGSLGLGAHVPGRIQIESP